MWLMMIEELWKACEGWVHEERVVAPPPGTELPEHSERRPFLRFSRRRLRLAKSVQQTRFVPPSPQYHQAIWSLCEGADTVLSDFPE